MNCSETGAKERVIQFGEGGFLRGFFDWMLQKMAAANAFEGKVVVVQPIEDGLCDALTAQGCKYTHLMRGAEGVETTMVDVISRCVKPYEDFDASPILEGLDLTDDLLSYILLVANGEQTKQEKMGYHDISIFRDGVTL